MRKMIRGDLRIALIPALLAGIVYVRTLAPTVTSEDSGELIAAACTLGVPHPPGYPLWCLLGKAFSLLPIGSPAWRLAFMSAAFAVGTVGLVYAICWVLEIGRVGATVAALCLAFSHTFWSQSVIAEVYTLNLFLLASVVLLLLLWGKTGQRRWFAGAAAVFGLALANHYPLMLLVSPALAAYVLWTRPSVLRDVRLLLTCAALAAAGLLVYGYLPLAAASNPPINWGEPNTWARFWAVVTRADFRSVDVQRGVGVLKQLRFLVYFLQLLLDQFTPFVFVPLAALGVWQMRRRPKAATLLAGVFALNSFLLIMLLRMAYDAENRSRVEAYFLPAYMCASIVMGAGVGRLAGLFGERRGLARAAVLACAAVPALALVAHWHSCDMSHYYIADDYNRAVLETLEPNAIYFTTMDGTAFPSIYLQAVEGLRPDVILATPTPNFSPGAREYIAQLPSLVDPAHREGPWDRVIAFGTRPVYIDVMYPDFISMPGVRLEPWGLVYRMLPSKSPLTQPVPDVFERRPLRNLSTPTPVGFMAARMLTQYHVMWGESLMQQGRPADAIAQYRKAAETDQNPGFGLHVLGYICLRWGLEDEALEFLRVSASQDARNASVRWDLAALLEMRGEIAAALRVYEEIAEITPGDPLLQRKISALRERLRAER